MGLINKETGEIIMVGDKVVTFRGEEGILEGYEAPRHAASTGRVYVRLTDKPDFQNEWYPSVIGAKIV